MPQPHGGMSPASAASAPTGPDGVPLHDETSQQSTLSQSSDRSDGRQTPKTSASLMPGQGYTPSSAGPASPRSSAPSPGGSMGSAAEYPRDMASPNWQRTQASPGSGQQVIRSDVLVVYLMLTMFTSSKFYSKMDFLSFFGTFNPLYTTLS